MRGRITLVAALFALTAACGRKSDAVSDTAALPAAVGTGTGQTVVDTGTVKGQVLVTITFVCNNGGATIGVHPWHAQLLDRSDSIKWKLNATNATEVTLEAKGTSPWPFIDGPPTVGGNGAISKDLKPGLAKGAYAYKITGVCGTGPAEYKVILDPDMIIPD